MSEIVFLTARDVDINGISDASATINSIFAESPNGCQIVLPSPAILKADNIIGLGNGTTSLFSTQNGVSLLGTAPVCWPLGDFSTSPYQKWCTVIRASSKLYGADAVVQVNGPIFGSGIKNLLIDANSQTTYAVDIASSVGGIYESCGAMGAGVAPWHTKAVTPGTFNINTQFNQFRNISLLIPATAYAKGLFLEGNGVNVNSNTSHNVWTNTILEASINTSLSTYCAYFKDCDNESFYHTTFLKTGTSGSGSNYPMAFDFTGSGGGNFPTDMSFVHTDFGNTTLSAIYAGSPLTGLTVARFKTISSGNGRPPNPALTGLVWDAS